MANLGDLVVRVSANIDGFEQSMGTVSSSWWPEVAAVGRRLTTDLFACGRTVRYAGPPS